VIAGIIAAATGGLLLGVFSLYLTELDRAVRAETELAELKFQLMFNKESK
jgi:hypothetical protein